MSKRILVIGMADSVHLARWLNQFSESDLTFEIVSSSPHRRIHPKIQGLLQGPSPFHLGVATRVLSLPLWIADRLFSDFFRGLLIALVARRFRPDIVHIFESQNGGYAFLRARGLSKALSTCPAILTIYGSDIYWFKDYRRDREKLRKLLAAVSFISAECERDEKLAMSLGYRGKFLPRIPAAGGVTWPASVPSIEERHIISIKGYENKWGRASNALLALEPIAKELKCYEIVLFSCNRKILPLARRFSKKTGLSVRTYTKGRLTHDEVQGILRQSVMLIGLSRSDGLPASMVEAMANGAVPIQSDSSCCDEWIEDGKAGFIVRFDDVSRVTEVITQVLESKSLRREALSANRRRILERLSPEELSSVASSTYDSIP